MPHRHLNDLPVFGKRRHDDDDQATIDELSNLVMPVINHPEIEEIGFSVTYLTMDSDPEIYEVRKIWVQTIHDDSRAPHELGLWATDHPTLGRVLFGDSDTELGRNVDAWWNALRDSRYRNAVLSVFGRGDVRMSSGGIRVMHDEEMFGDDWR